MAREFGTAFAVLAIYVLTLLLPLHQAAGLQRDLDRLGFETLTAWSVCAPLVQDEDGNPKTATVVKCPAAGFGKQDFVAIAPASLPIGIPAPASIVAWAAPSIRLQPSIPEHFGQSRAPPVAV
tara:strand:- start:1073 stop:1441 length:369 start_codon:yes stop_codon:yes gene_type:complete